MKRGLNPLLALLVLVLFVLSLLVGPAHLGLMETLRGFMAGGSEATAIILRDIRLPRALLGVLTGASLGLSGAVLQGLLRNPLADPGLIGVSATASLGAVLAFYSGLAAASAIIMPLGALLGGALAVLILLAVAGRGNSTLTLILAGVALSSLAGALISLALNLSRNPFASYEISFWLLGSLKDRSMNHVVLVAPLMLAGWLAMALSARALDALSLGEEAAHSLGVDMKRLRILVIAGVALATGAATAVTGMIGFVGLVVPHLGRPFTTQLPSAVLLPSALGGAALLTAADIFTRLLVTNVELNVGVVTALIGAPFFFWLVFRSRWETA